MAIPSVIGGTVETDTGKVIELDSAKGAEWLEMIGSFRYEPTGDGKPYTVRKEGKNGEYWYGCRKIEGKVRKKYIGKSSEVSVAKLEEIAEALEIPAEPRVDKVAEVAERVAEVAQSPQVVEQVAESRVTALELQVAELLKAVKDLQEALPGKFDAGDSPELPEVGNEVVERLQNELSNLKAENEVLKQELEIERAEYTKLLASSSLVTDKLREEVRQVRSQLATERADREQLETELTDLKQNSAIDFTGKAGDLLSWLRKTVGRALPKQVTLAQIKKILEGA